MKDAASASLAGAIAIRFDDALAHAVGEVARIQAQEQPEPSHGEIDQAVAAHLAAFGSSPPSFAARISAASLFTSALPARRPASVMR